jgi:hypothetical protein
MAEWKDANVEKPEDNRLCVVWANDQRWAGSWGHATDYVIGWSRIYGRDYEPPQGQWIVADGCGGYYPGDHDASEYGMKDTFWYYVLEPPHARR